MYEFGTLAPRCRLSPSQENLQEGKIYRTEFFLNARRRLWIRWSGLLALLLGEFAGLTLAFDEDPVVASLQFWPLNFILAYTDVDTLLAIGVVSLLFSVILLWPRLPVLAPTLQAQASRYRWWPWLLLHGLALGVLFHLTGLMHQPTTTDSPALSGFQLLAWLGSGSALLACWMLALAPARAWWWLARTEYPRLLVALAMGLAVWAATVLNQDSWLHLAEATLRLSHLLIQPFFSDVVYDPASRILGTTAFQVEISPQCSGSEGMILISGFLTVYLWLFRDRLRWPAALALFPIGIAAAWLANGLRIALLIALGDLFSPEIAISGFHSKAGWIAFIAIALGLVAVTRRFQWFTITPAGSDHRSPNAILATALLAPLLVLMTTTLVSQAFSSGFDLLYPLRVILTGLTLWFFRKAYSGLGWTVSWRAVAIGSLVFVLWMAFEPDGDSGGANALAAELAELGFWPGLVWLIFRVAGAVITVPLAEELAFRGYLLRKMIHADFENVALGRWTGLSLLGSSLLFGLLHSSWLAGTLAGMGYAFALHQRGQMGDAVIAHATTNALIAVWVLTQSEWVWWTG